MNTIKKLIPVCLVAGMFTLASCDNLQKRSDADEKVISRDTVGVEREVEIEETTVEYDTTTNTKTFEVEGELLNRTTDPNITTDPNVTTDPNITNNEPSAATDPNRTTDPNTMEDARTETVTDIYKQEIRGTGTGAGTATGVGTTNRGVILDNTVDKLSRLSDEQLKEVSNYAEFLLNKNENPQSTTIDTNPGTTSGRTTTGTTTGRTGTTTNRNEATGTTSGTPGTTTNRIGTTTGTPGTTTETTGTTTGN